MFALELVQPGIISNCRFSRAYVCRSLSTATPSSSSALFSQQIERKGSFWRSKGREIPTLYCPIRRSTAAAPRVVLDPDRIHFFKRGLYIIYIYICNSATLRLARCVSHSAWTRWRSHKKREDATSDESERSVCDVHSLTVALDIRLCPFWHCRAPCLRVLHTHTAGNKQMTVCS